MPVVHTLFAMYSTLPANCCYACLPACLRVRPTCTAAACLALTALAVFQAHQPPVNARSRPPHPEPACGCHTRKPCIYTLKSQPLQRPCRPQQFPTPLQATSPLRCHSACQALGSNFQAHTLHLTLHPQACSPRPQFSRPPHKPTPHPHPKPHPPEGMGL